MERGREGDIIVLTQNAWGGAPLWTRRRERLARAIAEVEPDVVSLQEIHAPSARGDEGQAHEIAERIGGYSVVFAPARTSPSGACEGVALLVRAGIEIEDRSSLRLSIDPDDPLDAPHPRVILCATIKLRSGARVDAMATHLSLSHRARARTIREIVIFASETAKSSKSDLAVLAGDLNASPTESSLDALERASWTDAWDAANPNGSGATWPAAVAFRRLDYIWARLGAGFRVRACERMPVAGSDHVGLWTRITSP
jgi:endonuclease/exonuclease/phosphatase family metal-dependent hydrolase